jgi:predicted small metal-binding protein
LVEQARAASSQSGGGLQPGLEPLDENIGPSVPITPILRAVSSGPTEELVVRCECGFETRGTADQIVPALQKHAGESHNMKVTREQVLARALPV